MKIRILLGAAAALVMASQARSEILLYQNDFDGNEARDAGVSGFFTGLPTEGSTVGPWNAAGWAGNYGGYRATDNSFATLALTGLAPHTHITASFLVGFLESWDSYDGSCCAPDNLEIWIDGVQVSNMTYNNALGSMKDIDGGTLVAEYVQANFNTFYTDTLVDMGTDPNFSFAHTGSSLTLAFRATGGGWQGSTDEGFGLDDVHITYDGVHTKAAPEPAAWALMIAGFGLAGATLRRRRMLAA